jgi:hypothetical protein
MDVSRPSTITPRFLGGIKTYPDTPDTISSTGLTKKNVKAERITARAILVYVRFILKKIGLID